MNRKKRRTLMAMKQERRFHYQQQKGKQMLFSAATQDRVHIIGQVLLFE